MALGPAQKLDRCSFSANNVVALDNRSDPDRLVMIVLLFVHADDASMSSYKHFRTARDLSGQRESEINFCSRSKVLLHHKINAASRDVPCLAVVGRGLAIDRQTDIN